MNDDKYQRPLLPLILLSLCLVVLGINGFVGGYLMLRDPIGSPMGMPVTYLENTPFNNWIVPALWLIFIWGFGSLVILAGLWVRPEWSGFDIPVRWTHEHWPWVLSIALGLALLVWLTVQVFTLPEMAPIQFILYGLAALLIILPLLPSMREYYRVDEENAVRSFG